MTIRRRISMSQQMLQTMAIATVAMLSAGQAFAQLQSVGGSDSPVLSCFYECKPGPDVQDESTYRQVTTLPVVNNSHGRIHEFVRREFHGRSTAT